MSRTENCEKRKRLQNQIRRGKSRVERKRVDNCCYVMGQHATEET